MNACQAEIRRFCVEYLQSNPGLRLFLSQVQSHAFVYLNTKFSPKGEYPVWNMSELSFVFLFFFNPARRSRLSWLVKMEAGALATVGDYWYAVPTPAHLFTTFFCLDRHSLILNPLIQFPLFFLLLYCITIKVMNHCFLHISRNLADKFIIFFFLALPSKSLPKQRLCTASLL